MKQFDAVPPPVGSGETPELYRLPGLKFQALCRDLLDSGGDPEISACREYGTPGQRQHGIDLIADRQDGGIDVAQCKCERDFPPKKIRDASDEFLKYIDFWRSKGLKRFIVLVGSEVLQTQRRAEILRQKELFKGQHGISYELWPSTRVVNRLRSFRGIVSQHLSPGWVDILCGPTTESSVQTELAQHAALIDHLVLALTGATDERLLAMREAWREGRRYEAQRMLTLTKADGFTWTALPPNVRASYLRFEGSVILESEGDTSRAAALVDEAHALHASPDDERLRAAILWRRGDSDAALGVLGSAKDDTLRHFKSFLLITVRRVEEAEALLTEVSKETAETFQLRDYGLERVQFALALAWSGSLRWRIQILSDSSPAHVEMALNLANGPFLGHVEPV